MKTIRFSIAAFLGILGSSLGISAQAAENPMDFLHALQQNGYPDMAVDYLKMLKSQPDVPAEVVELYDLEMSRSLRASSKGAYNEAEAKRYQAEAETYLNKFIKENPKHPKAIEAAASWADISLVEALKEIRRAKDLTDKKEKAEAYANARKILEDVQPRYAKAADNFVSLLSRLPALSQRSTKREVQRHRELEDQAIEGRLKTAIADFYRAQAYDDPNAPERKTILTKASKTFDDIFQTSRGSILGLNAHFWHGRSEHEMGDTEEAMSIYEEVLANAPDSGGEKRVARRRELTGLEELYAATEQYRLEIMAKKTPKEYFREAKEWLDENKATSERTDGYQGISFELAKAYIAAADRLSDDAKQRILKAAVTILQGMLKVPSQYQAEVLKLTKDLKEKYKDLDMGDSGFEQKVAEADETASKKGWIDAAAQYTEALEMAEAQNAKPGNTNRIDAKRLKLVRDAISKCYFNLAHEQFGKNKLKECRATIDKILKEYREFDVAPKSATLLVTLSINEYAAITDDKEHQEERDAAREKLIKTCEGILKVWPGKPEADFARLNLGKLKLFDKKEDEGIKTFNDINPQSEYYPIAKYLGGYTRWRQYHEEAAKPKDRDEDKVKAYRDEALKTMSDCVAVHRKAQKEGARLPAPMVEAVVMLAEMKLEIGETKESAALFQELVDDIIKEKPENLNPAMLRIFNGAVKAYLQLEDVDNAGKVASLLIKLGPDIPQTNAALLGFSARLDKERKRAEEMVAQAATPNEADKAKEKLASYEKLLSDMLMNLAGREKVSAKGMMWIAQACVNVGLGDEAEKLSQKLLDQIEEDPQVKAEVGPGVPRLRVVLIQLLRKKGKYADAFQQASKLAAENEKALEPRIEKAMILQTWAEQEPENYEKAVLEWEKIRQVLERTKPKKGSKTQRMPEYYEVTYNESLCLHNFAKTTKDKAEAAKRSKQGEQLLGQILLLDSTLSADNRKRFKALVEKLQILQGKDPAKKPDTKKAEPEKKAE